MTVRSSGSIRTLFEGGTVAGLTDGDLLGRYVASRGDGEAAEVAFAALVDRHGPMVLGVCRRIIADRHAADDAFQATFLILARRAGSVRVAGTLARWLYGVSRRVALRERSLALRRPEPAGNFAETWEARQAGGPPRELRGALDEEVARLPRALREVVMLRHFEGLALAEIASRLGCPPGTVGSRLTRARSLLGSRLTRRGFGPAALLGASAEARADVPAHLARATARLAASGSVPAAVMAISAHTLRTMAMTKIRSYAAAAFLASAFAAGAGAFQAGGNAGPGGRPEATGPPARSREFAPTPAQEYDRLVRECRRYVEEEAEARKKGGNAAEDFRRTHPVFFENGFAPRFLELARFAPRDPAAFDSLLWVAVFDFTEDAAEEAASILARDYGHDPRLWQACQEMKRGPIYPAQGILLRAIHRENPDRAIRGRAGLALAAHLIREAEFVRLARSRGPGPYQARFFPAARMEEFRGLDPEAMVREAEEACERVAREYPDVRPVALVRSPNIEFDARTIYLSVQDAESPKGTLGELARAKLDEIRSVGVGQPAPEISGEDAKGDPMKLEDYRGKVVLLTFSGAWCGPCVSMYPHQRELMQRFEGRPFAILGVGSDKTRDELVRSVEAGTITWRSWWEPIGDEPGPIASRWHIDAWPTIIAIDHRGTIRARTSGTLGRDDKMVTGLDDVIDALIGEAEEAGHLRPGPAARSR